jgi:hypothetical protein
MSRDSTLVMFFHMRLEKHVCNAMSHDLLLALAVVSLDHLRTPALLCDLCCYLWSESEIWRTSFAVGFSPIPDDIDCCLLLQAGFLHACVYLVLIQWRERTAAGGRPNNAARISTVSRSWAGVIVAAFFSMQC